MFIRARDSHPRSIAKAVSWRLRGSTEEERAIVCALRRATGFPLDDLTLVVTHFLPHLNRDAVYRILKAEGLGRLPPASRPRKRFSSDYGSRHREVGGRRRTVCRHALYSPGTAGVYRVRTVTALSSVRCDLSGRSDREGGQEQVLAKARHTGCAVRAQSGLARVGREDLGPD